MSETVFKPLSKRALLRKGWFRDLTLSTIIAGAIGSVTYQSAAHYLPKAQDALVQKFGDADREVARLELDVEALSGALERKIAKATDELERHYNQGTLNIFETLKLATPAELEEFEKIIQNSREFEEHYNFAERLRIFKDRVDKRLLGIDDELEKMQPGAVQRLNDGIRNIFGQKSGEEGRRHRQNIRGRLDELCRIYDTNEDNRRAQAVVLEKLNDYLAKADTLKLDGEERELYGFLADQYEKEGGAENVRQFIKNKNFDPGNQAYLHLRASITEAEKLYGQIRENKEYVVQLQDLLKEGIEQKKGVRKLQGEEFAKHRKEIQTKVDELKESVDEVIDELKAKGYNIHTREDIMAEAARNGPIGRTIRALTDPFVDWGSLVLGFLAAYVTFRASGKNRRVRSARSALGYAVEKYNALLEERDCEQAKNYFLERRLALTEETYRDAHKGHSAGEAFRVDLTHNQIMAFDGLSSPYSVYAGDEACVWPVWPDGCGTLKCYPNQ